jgi:hypothetical protein
MWLPGNLVRDLPRCLLEFFDAVPEAIPDFGEPPRPNKNQDERQAEDNLSAAQIKQRSQAHKARSKRIQSGLRLQTLAPHPLPHFSRHLLRLKHGNSEFLALRN